MCVCVCVFTKFEQVADIQLRVVLKTVLQCGAMGVELDVITSNPGPFCRL